MSVPALGPRGEGWVAGQLVLFAAIGLGGLAYGVATLPLLVAGIAMVVLGVAVVALGAWELGSNLTPFPRPRPAATLVQDGLYRHVRHPIYSGVVTAAVGWALVTASPLSLIFAVLLALLFDAKSRREEAWLSEQLPGYAGYRARTRKFVPGLY